MLKVDFHLHTWCSDGHWSPSELLSAVRGAGVDWFVVSDHDTLAGFRRLRGTAGLLPAVEASADHLGREVHVVGLGIDPDHAELNAFLAETRRVRVERITALLARIPEEARGSLTVADLRDDRDPDAGQSLGRAHLARALVRNHGVATMSEAFSRWLGDDHLTDTGLPAFPGLRATAEMLRAAGGVAILAHPGVYHEAALVGELMQQGTLDGIESSHPGLDATLALSIASQAKEYGWLESCGTDLHGPGRRRPGDAKLSDERLAPLLVRLGVQ